MSEAQKSQRKVLIRAKTNKKKLATIIEKEKSAATRSATVSEKSQKLTPQIVNCFFNFSS